MERRTFEGDMEGHWDAVEIEKSRVCPVCSVEYVGDFCLCDPEPDEEDER